VRHFERQKKGPPPLFSPFLISSHTRQVCYYGKKMKMKIEKNPIDALLCTRIYTQYLGLVELARPSIANLKYKPYGGTRRPF